MRMAPPPLKPLYLSSSADGVVLSPYTQKKKNCPRLKKQVGTPFHAVPFTPHMRYTHLQLFITHHTQCLAPNEPPIPGTGENPFSRIRPG